MKAVKVITERDEEGKIKNSVLTFNGNPIPEGFKYCPACEAVLTKESFSAKGNACKPCANKRAREHHHNRMKSPEYREARRKHYNALNKKAKAFVVDYFGDKCFDCGGSFHRACYDVHHLDPSLKDFNVGNVNTISDKLIKELEKCVMLCSNCHRIRHWGNIE
jgi:hypothetical protein